MQRVVHVIKSNPEFRSRLRIMRGWDGSDEAVCFSEKGAWRRLTKLAREPVTLVFHQQASLPFLIALRLWVGDGFRAVYDIADANEWKPGDSLYRRVRNVALHLMEWFVFQFDIEYTTVSRGLRYVYFKRFGKSPRIAMNIPSNVLTDEEIEAPPEGQKRAIHFGQLHPIRLSMSAIDRLHELGYALDLWGVVVQDMTYEDRLKAHPMYEAGKLRLRGPFTSDDLSFIQGYDFMVQSVQHVEAINYRFGMPNKFIQSSLMGVPSVLSHNMREIRVRFPGLILDMQDVENGTFDVDRVKLARGVRALGVSSKREYLAAIGREPVGVKP